VGRLAGGEVVFVPRAAPGDACEIEVDAGRRPATARILRILSPGPDRVEPPCLYLAACGGCDWMHLTPAAQARGHAAIVRAAIAHALPDAALPEVTVHTAPAELGYRSRARLFVEADRRGVRVGYRAAASHELAPVDRCLVLHPALAPILGRLGAVLAGARGEGDAAVALGQGGLPVVSLEWRGELPAAAWAALDAEVKGGAWAGARVLLAGASMASTFGDPRPVLAGADGAPLIVAAGGFAQPSDEGAAILARRVDELSRLGAGERPRRVLELFAGSGTLSILLAQGAATFSAVEIGADAVTAARQNLAARGLRGKVTAGDADATAVPAETSVVVLDPPRAGAAGASRAIAASLTRAVVYVACDPTTLARDLATLARGRLAVTHVETFELFPQTSHVETVVRLARAR
jgi:23S rRNA (uracil1939-C5)-methyltransferase